MEYRRLGNSQRQVSALAMGTVSLGVDYGIETPDGYGRPSDREAIDVLRAAAKHGITLYDTAPNYGEAERLLGEALGNNHECLFATKVNIPRSADGSLLRGSALQDAVFASVDSSRARLQRDCIDILQIHNASLDVLQDADFMTALEACRETGRVRLLGASVYTEQEALASVESRANAVLQAAFNLLDQRLRTRLLPAARARGTAFLARSAYLKGVLTPKARWLPDSLLPLRQAAGEVCERFGIDWDELPAYALRFCLSEADVTSVLIGPRTREELDIALQAAAGGALPAQLAAQTGALALQDSNLLNPATWPVS